MDVFVTGQRAELVDAGLDVVAGDRLALSDRCQVDLVFDRLVGLDCFVGHGDAESLLRPHHGDPQFTLEHDLALGGPDLVHRFARVAGREHVHHGICRHGVTVPFRSGVFKNPG